MFSSGKTKIIRFIFRVDKGLSLVESGILILTLSVMVVIAFLQVILRSFFSFSILWGDPLLRHLVLWIGFLGASLATREDRHINIDALTRILQPSWRRRVRVVTNLFSALVSCFLVRASFVFVRDEFSAQTTLFLGIPLGLFVGIILIGFIVITLRFLLKALCPFQANASTEVS